ncbi:MAG TPA: hypothetical protein VMR33_10555 [Candidatus Baltobacteraceae bacterium]|nr:hypothetical protein [Candidatus Baltobacteraceae bacterium]
MKRRRPMRGLEFIQFAGLIMLIGFISRYSGPGDHTPMTASVILVVGASTLALMWLTSLKARE